MQLFSNNNRISQLWEQLVSENLRTSKVVPIGRGHAGKTNLINCIPRVLDTLPSGIRIGYNDLLTLNEALTQVRLTEQDLHRAGLPPTLERSFRSIGLFRDESRQMSLDISDEIGQPITNTTSESPKEQIQRFEDYINASRVADVLWVTTSLPLSDSSQSLGLFRDDLARYQCWLSESISHRTTANPVSVAIVVTKVDALFSTAKEAENQLSATWLSDQALKPIVDIVKIGIRQGRVAQGTIVPVSAFGFGNSQLIERTSEGGIAYEDSEEEFRLASHSGLTPYNVLPLLTWTFLAAASTSPNKPFKEIAKLLFSDLESLGACWFPLRS